MTIHQSDYAKRNKSQPYPSESGVVVACRATFTVPANIVELDIVELLELPPNCRFVEAIFDSDDLDTGTPAIVWDVGMMSGVFGTTDPARTCGDELFDGITTSQAGGLVRTTDRRALRLGPSSTSRGIGAKLVTDAATAQAGEIGLTIFYATA